MPFRYSYICELLSALETLKTRDVALLPRDLAQRSKEIVRSWFAQHRRVIDAPDTDGVALLSTLFPERRTDRVYGLQEKRLSQVVGRALYFNTTRIKIFGAYTNPGNGDLGACLERALQPFDAELKRGSPVTVEEIDKALQKLASRCSFSSPAVRALVTDAHPDEILRPLLLRMSSTEAKWMIRLILKNFSPVILEEYLVLYHYHFLLPGLLRFQNDFGAAINLLRTNFKRYHANPDPRSQQLFKQEATRSLAPRVGVKVGRPPFWKARSVKHCMDMALSLGSQWSLERKYDGEYCEIHVDLSKGEDCIQIFSKSGKDSTQDRRRVHKALKDSLRIGSPSCFFKQRCIVLAELVAYSDRHGMQPFEKIRKHVDRSGRRIGAELDSPVQSHEHLMLVYFDVLMVDDQMLLCNVYDQRRDALKKLIRKREGYAMTSERRPIDMSGLDAEATLRWHFASALANRAEGLVLKPANLPYASLGQDDEEEEDAAKYSAFIKLKPDYMQELGNVRDVADFAVVGASYDAKLAQQIGLKGHAFTAFHLGCLTNPGQVRFGATPLYQMVGVITADQCIPKGELRALNDWIRFRNAPFIRKADRLADPQTLDLMLDTTEASKMSSIVTEPCVVEVLGSGFVKPPSSIFYMLRHPRILRLHLDRDWREAVTFDDLQHQALVARNAPAQGETQETLKIMEILVAKHYRHAEESLISARMTTASKSSVSPRSVLRVRTALNTESPCPPRRSPTKKAPVSVRVDTEELNAPRAPVRDVVHPRILRRREDGSNSIPTPPSTSPGKVQAAPSAPGNVLRPQVKQVQTKKRPLDCNAAGCQISPRQSKQARHSDTAKPGRPKTTSTSEDLSLPPDPKTAAPDSVHSSFENLTISPKAPRAIAMASPPRQQTRLVNNGDKPSEANRAAISSQPCVEPFELSTTCWMRNAGACSVKEDDDPATCVLSQIVVVLTPCVNKIPWVVKDVLPWHGAVVIDHFEHLVRDTASYDPLVDDTVPESQAYPGKKRVVLVERNRPQQNNQQVEIMKTHDVKDKLFWMDWRICDDWHALELGRRKSELGQGHQLDVVAHSDAVADVLARHLLCTTTWNESKKDWTMNKRIDKLGLYEALTSQMPSRRP